MTKPGLAARGVKGEQAAPPRTTLQHLPPGGQLDSAFVLRLSTFSEDDRAAAEKFLANAPTVKG